MNTNSESRPRRPAGLRWIAAGFIGAFAASIITVIYTGLNVEGSRRALQSGFQSITLAVGELRAVEVAFESDRSVGGATLEFDLPEIVAASRPDDLVRRNLRLAPGANTFAIELRAVTPGNGFVVASLTAREPIGAVRVYLTVTEP